jgi:ATP-binding cassette subfamily B protein RaxB
VRVDGQPLGKFGHRNYREGVGAVLQEDHVFAGSLADNIALFDDHPDPALIVSSSQAAGLHDDILRMPQAYDTLVGDMGSTLSGGQKQRLLLARALYRQPQVLILDEGTSHLEPALEAKVNESISKLGITRIIVAHRHETILAGQRILSLEKGRLTNVTEEFRTAHRDTPRTEGHS